MRRLLRFAYVLALLLLVGDAAVHRSLPVAAQAQQAWAVQVGGDVPDEAVTMTAFFPEALTVHVGDTVTWRFPSERVLHNVFFTTGKPAPPAYIIGPGDGERTLSPVWFPFGPLAADGSYDGSQQLGSGAAFDGPNTEPFRLTFTSAGLYAYVCTLHLGMHGAIQVLATGAQLAETPAQATARGQADFQTRLTGLHTFGLQPNPPAIGNRLGDAQIPALGATVHTASAGLDIPNGVSALQYLPADLTVHRGDVVVWSNSDTAEFHTITFTSGAVAPGEYDIRPQAAGPPLYVVPAAVNLPAGGSVYTGEGYLNSGILRPATAFVLTIDAPPGTYPFVCLIHRDVMKGTITVLDDGQ